MGVLPASQQHKFYQRQKLTKMMKAFFISRLQISQASEDFRTGIQNRQRLKNPSPKGLKSPYCFGNESPSKFYSIVYHLIGNG